MWTLFPMQSDLSLIGLLEIYWCSSPGLSLSHVTFFFTALTLCLLWKTTIIEVWSEHLSFFEAQNGLRIRGQTTVVSSKETNCATNWNSPYLGWEIALSNSKQCLRGPNENLHQDLSASISIFENMNLLSTHGGFTLLCSHQKQRPCQYSKSNASSGSLNKRS